MSEEKQKVMSSVKLMFDLTNFRGIAALQSAVYMTFDEWSRSILYSLSGKPMKAPFNQPRASAEMIRSHMSKAFGLSVVDVKMDEGVRLTKKERKRGVRTMKISIKMEDVTSTYSDDIVSMSLEVRSDKSIYEVHFRFKNRSYEMLHEKANIFTPVFY